MVKGISGRAPSLISISGKAVAASTLWTVAAAALLAKLLDSQVLSMEQIGYPAMGVLLISGALAAFLSMGKSEKPLAAVGLSLLGYLLVLIAVNLLFFGGDIGGLGVDAAVVVTGAGVAALVLRKGRGGATRSRHKIRHR